MQDRLSLQQETEKLSWRLDHWRRRHRPPAAIPAELWEQIVDLAARQGVGRTSRALRLNRVELQEAVTRAGQPRFEVAQAADLTDLFGELGIELARCESPVPDAEELVLELEAKSGARMRVEARNVEATSLLELVRAFAS